MTENYDKSWDLIDSDEGYLPADKDAFERKYLEWETRDWPVWLKDHLTFPFTVERLEDEDDAYFTDIAKGHRMKVIGVEPPVLSSRSGRVEGKVMFPYAILRSRQETTGISGP